MPGVETLPDLEEATDTRTARQSPYSVILHNDDFNSTIFVATVLYKVFAYSQLKCITLMMEAHKTGRAVVWTGSLEVAELKVEQIHSCGGDPSNPKATPLHATIEPAA